jgi:hypothetical protein
VVDGCVAGSKVVGHFGVVQLEVIYRHYIIATEV